VTDTVLTRLRNLLSERPSVSLESPDRNPAAVLLLVYPKDGDYYIHLQKRAQHLERHGGEACFPGGTPEAGDGDLLQTALREAQEEEGIRPEDVTILGQMDDTLTRTGYAMKVFVGTIPYPYAFKPNPGEVEEVVDVPLKVLQDPSSWREEARWQQGKVNITYAYTFGPHVIYGATANIVGQFLDLMKRVNGNERL